MKPLRIYDPAQPAQRRLSRRVREAIARGDFQAPFPVMEATMEPMPTYAKSKSLWEKVEWPLAFRYSTYAAVWLTLAFTVVAFFTR